MSPLDIIYMALKEKRIAYTWDIQQHIQQLGH